MGVVGGSSEQETVKRAMAATFTAKLAQQFNWHGKKGKKSFKSLELRKIMFGVYTSGFLLYRQSTCSICICLLVINDVEICRYVLCVYN